MSGYYHFVLIEQDLNSQSIFVSYYTCNESIDQLLYLKKLQRSNQSVCK